MVEIQTTDIFARWLHKLDDNQARYRIQARIDRLSGGNAGDVKPVGKGVSEMRIDHGPGYRVYFVQRDRALVILLAGGTKKTQARDIVAAIDIAANLEIAT